jgi:hypothetical protein
LERLVYQARETQVADFDDALGVDEDVRGLEVPVEDVARVQVYEPIEELVNERFKNRLCDCGSQRRGVVLDYLL